MDLLSGVAPLKPTFTSATPKPMTSQQFLHSPLSVHQSLNLEGVFEGVISERQLSSLEDLFCQLVVRGVEDTEQQKQMIEAHFLERQTRAEYLYALIVCEYKRKKNVKRVLTLIEQFMLKDTQSGTGGDRLYRQAKVPNLMMIRIKILINFMQDYQKAVETADYLLMVTATSLDLTINVDGEVNFTRALDD